MDVLAEQTFRRKTGPKVAHLLQWVYPKAGDSNS